MAPDADTQQEDPQHDRFAEEQRPIETGAGLGGHADDGVPASDDRELRGRLQGLDPDELSRLTVLQPGTRLEQGGVYIDLAALDQGPFKALGGEEADGSHRYVAKRQTDHELWNRLAGDRETEIHRPTES